VRARFHEYDELKIRFERGGEDGSCRVVAVAPNGEASGRFEMPFSELELENLVLRLGRVSRGRRRMESSELSEARRFGTRLFEALFQERVRDLYRGARARAEDRGRGLRITLHLTGVPELLHIPWEYLCDEPDFLAISTWTPVVRYLDLPRQRSPLTLQPPLRILAMVSSPTDAATLDVAQERANLERALGGLIDAGAIELHWLEQASLRSLLRELRNGEFHIFHYIGHGLYDPGIEDGMLLLEDEHERGRPVSGRELGTILHDCTSLRLAVLNACEGARSARNDPFAGVATSLVQCEIPAVIAMQFEITDDAAVVFSEGFYEAVAADFPIDAALAEARKAIYANNSDTEWGTPVLFMRVPDGRVFDIPEPPQLPTPKHVQLDTATIREAGETTGPRSRLGLTADLTAIASAVLLLVALLPRWGILIPEYEGLPAAGHRASLVLLAVAVLALVATRRGGRLKQPSATILALALASVLIQDFLILKGGGGLGPGRKLAVCASLGVVLSGWLALTAAAEPAFRQRRGELIAAIGALIVIGCFFLEYDVNQKTGWEHFSHQTLVFAAPLGLILLMTLAPLALTNVNATRGAGALLALVGAFVAHRVAYPYSLHDGVSQAPDKHAVGYWAALGGALVIVMGGLIALRGGTPAALTATAATSADP
jgi:CHAT domain